MSTRDALRPDPLRPDPEAEGAHALVLPALGLITLVGFLVRLSDMGQSLYGDERYTYSIVSTNGVRGIWHQVYTTSITPPLHYYLAWLSLKIGGASPAMIRLPSLILGTIAVPLLFILGRRLGGPGVGLLAAGVLALSPFAIFYSTEGRAYETVVFLVAVATLALLYAQEGRGRGWWVVYALAACAALWSHYTAVFVLAALAVWSFLARPLARRPLIYAEIAIVVLYLPWIPGYLNQRHNQGVQLFNQFSSVNLGTAFGFPLRTLVARPFVAMTAVPGALGLALIAVLAVLLLAALPALATPGRRADARAGLTWLGTERGLILVLAVVTPIGLLLYSLFGPALFASDRELSASEPALIVLGSLIVVGCAGRAPRPVAVATLTAATAVFGSIAVRSASTSYQRPPYNDVAHYLDRNAGSSVPVVEEALAVSADARLGGSTLSLYFHHAHPLYSYRHNDDVAWAEASAGQTIYLLRGVQSTVEHAQGIDRDTPAIKARMARFAGPDGRAIVRATKTFPGFYPLVLQRLQGTVQGRLTGTAGHESISWTLDPDVRVQPGFAEGTVSGITPSTAPLLVGGYAVQASTHRPVDWVLFFAGGRLFAVSPGGIPNEAAEQAYGSGALLGGFGIEPRSGPSDHTRIRVFAVSGGHASELPFSAAARRILAG